MVPNQRDKIMSGAESLAARSFAIRNDRFTRNIEELRRFAHYTRSFAQRFFMIFITNFVVNFSVLNKTCE